MYVSVPCLGHNPAADQAGTRDELRSALSSWSRRRGTSDGEALVPSHRLGGNREAFLKVGAALSRCRMRGACRSVAEGSADLRQRLLLKPAIAHAAPDRPAIGSRLTGADMLVAAFVVEHENADHPCLPAQQHWIEDQQPGIRNRPS